MKRFHFKSLASPTFYHIARVLEEQGWRPAQFGFFSDFKESAFDFHLAAAQTLEFKHGLAQCVGRHCPEVMPVTYILDEEHWPRIIEKIAAHPKADEQAWILKPALLNNGQQIHLFSHWRQVQLHYLGTQRLGGPHVIQQYLAPHLLKGPESGHKYSVRLFVVLTNEGGAFVYPEGYFNVALEPYQAHWFGDLRSHLTNEHLGTEKATVIQIHSGQFEALFQSAYPRMKAHIQAVLQGVKTEHPAAFRRVKHQKSTLALFGFDFMLDAEERVWLLEANHAPCFPVDPHHRLQRSLYQDFWVAVVSHFVLPIAEDCPVDQRTYGVFERVL